MGPAVYIDKKMFGKTTALGRGLTPLGLLWPIYNVLGLWLCVSCDSGNVLCAEYGIARFRHCVHSQLGLFSCNGRVGWFQVVPKNPNYLASGCNLY